MGSWEKKKTKGRAPFVGLVGGAGRGALLAGRGEEPISTVLKLELAPESARGLVKNPDCWAHPPSFRGRDQKLVQSSALYFERQRHLVVRMGTNLACPEPQPRRCPWVQDGEGRPHRRQSAQSLPQRVLGTDCLILS